MRYLAARIGGLSLSKYLFPITVDRHLIMWFNSGCDAATAHSMSILLMVFALATLFDCDMPPYSVESYEYYILARLALRFAPPMYDTTLMAVQSMVGSHMNHTVDAEIRSQIYMAQYLEMSDCEPAHTGSQKAWTTIGHAVHLGHSVCSRTMIPVSR